MFFPLQVYCGHEYSLQNLPFGEHVEPDNQVPTLYILHDLMSLLQHIKDKIEWCKGQRGATPPLPTVPSTIAEEWLINPFMRVGIVLNRIYG